jgi:alpha-N-arabinofuranosidase
MTPNRLTGTIHVDPRRPALRYDRMIFGQFLEHFHRQVYGGVFEPGSPLSDQNGFRLDVIEALRELKIPVVRWPGGCFVSSYHWKDGIGPERLPSYDKAWEVEDPNTFGTDEFVAWCRLIGAEPYICTNAGTGTPEEMSDWVEYCNLKDLGRWARLRKANGCPEPHNVHYWSIGNENYGDWEMGAKTVAEWGHFVAESAKLIKRVDPAAVLLAAALPDQDWTLALLKAAGKYLDYVSIHYYGDRLHMVDNPSDYATCMTRVDAPERIIRTTEQIIGVAGYEGKIGIAFDEWNLRGWHHPRLSTPAAIAARDRNDLSATYTMADAVFSANVLNICLRHAATVKMANMAPVVNTRGPLYVHPGGVVRRTTFHVLAMYANLLAENVVDAHLSSDTFTHAGVAVPVLDGVATCGDGAGWKLAMVNRHPSDALDCKVLLGSQVLEGRVSATILSGDSPDAYNSPETPNRVVPQRCELEVRDGAVTLPPHSISILELEM